MNFVTRKFLFLAIIFFAFFILLKSGLVENIDAMTGYNLKKIVRYIKGVNLYDYGVDRIDSKFQSEIHKKYNFNKNAWLQKYNYIFDYSWLENKSYIFIAHRLGNVFIGGENTKKTLMNSIDDFDFFETDLVFTKDNILVLYHPTPNDLKNNFQIKNFTFDQIKKIRNIEKFDEIIKIINKKNNKFLILDSPENFVKTIDYIDKNYSREIKKKIIPQIYSADQLSILKDRNFLGPIFTSYATKETTDQIIHFSLNNNIRAVTLTPYRLSITNIEQHLDKLFFFTHAVDNPFEAFQYKLKGVSGIYSKILNKNNFGLISRINKDNYLYYSP